jgi:HSP20 family molecular chaperone IbpA
LETQSKRGVIMTTLTPELAVAHEWRCAEIHTTDEKFEVEVETPTLGPDDLLVEVEGHTLTVQGRPEHGHHAAAFTFTFFLPAEANLERLHAEFVEGALKVATPLHRDGKRTVEIEQPHLIHAEASGGSSCSTAVVASRRRSRSARAREL